MKLVLMTALLLTSFTLFADDEGKGKNFEDRKAKAIEMMDKRIATMNEHKSCISGASDKEAMKECRKSHREKMKEMKKMRKERKKARKEKRKKKDK